LLRAWLMLRDAIGQGYVIRETWGWMHYTIYVGFIGLLIGTSIVFLNSDLRDLAGLFGLPLYFYFGDFYLFFKAAMDSFFVIFISGRNRGCAAWPASTSQPFPTSWSISVTAPISRSGTGSIPSAHFAPRPSTNVSNRKVLVAPQRAVHPTRVGTTSSSGNSMISSRSMQRLSPNDSSRTRRRTVSIWHRPTANSNSRQSSCRWR
jgi:hypothetical protein